MGIRYVKVTSNFKVPYIISLGDFFSQNAFINPESNVEEIITCVAYCINKTRPVIFDVGAHCGFHSTHFASLLKKSDPVIYAFEPVAPTYFDLVKGVNKLNLTANVFPIHAALSNEEDIVTLKYSRWESMLAQVVETSNTDPTPVRDSLITTATTLNKVCRKLNVFPDLIKLDVEGYESFVLKGASQILQHEKKPAICIEWNPDTLLQCGSSPAELSSLLSGYDLYYVNDYQFGKKRFLEKIDDIGSITWVCNVFAFPSHANFAQWMADIDRIKKQFNITIPYQ